MTKIIGSHPTLKKICNFLGITFTKVLNALKQEIHRVVQGVSQNFGHLVNGNFSASEAPRIKMLDIFRRPGQF